MSPDGRVELRTSDDLGRTWRDAASPFAGLPRPTRRSRARTSVAPRHGTTVLMACRMWIVSPDDPRWNDDAAGVIGADCLAVRARQRRPWETPASYDFRRHAERVGDPVRSAACARRRRGPTGSSRWNVTRSRTCPTGCAGTTPSRCSRTTTDGPGAARARRSTTPTSASPTTTSGWWSCATAGSSRWRGSTTSSPT